MKKETTRLLLVHTVHIAVVCDSRVSTRVQFDIEVRCLYHMRSAAGGMCVGHGHSTCFCVPVVLSNVYYPICSLSFG